MHLGIDLGTSNSVIVGNKAGVLTLFRTPEGSETLPSALLLDRRGGMFVGLRAYEQAAYAPENVLRGFKRLMGTKTVMAAAGNMITPEEASAEILKSLVLQAYRAAGPFSSEGVIITIPAAFNQMQCEATMRAASAAGITNVALLQEPVAAALASVSGDKVKDGQFLVYDLGGGTFDVAIVQAIGGAVNVVGHAGINMCGGRDIDRGIVNSLVRPWLLKNFDLPPDFHRHKDYERLIRIAEHGAEAAKVAMSTNLAARIFVDEGQVNTTDASGKPVHLDVEVTRAQIEVLVWDQIDTTIDHCRQLLRDNGYRSSDIDRIVMIGGPTKMPIIRARVFELLKIPVDVQTDPMTAVACGAAIYAESREWVDGASTSKNVRGVVSTPGPVEIKLDFPARTADDKIKVRAMLTAGGDSAYGFRLDGEDGWSSGIVKIKRAVTIKDVPLSHDGEHRFRASVFDANGIPVAEATSDFTVMKARATAAGIPATQNIAVKIVEGSFGSERNTLHPIVRKGALLPASGSEKFLAARDMRANDGTELDFELYEMADGVTDPHFNLFIGSFRLRASDMAPGEVIRKGDDVFVRWAVDDNGLLNCGIEIPAIGQYHQTGKMYVDRDALRNFDGAEGRRLATEALQDVLQDIRLLEKTLGAAATLDAQKLDRRLADLRKALELAYDADSLRSISNEAMAIRQKISRMRNRPENAAAVTRTELDDFMTFYGESVGRNVGDKMNSQVHRLARLASDALASGTQHGVEDARLSLQQLRQIVNSYLFKDIEFLTSLFTSNCEQRHLAFDKELHDRLAGEGEKAIQTVDVDELRQVLGKMYANLPHQGEPNVEGLSGLMRAW